MAKGYEIPIKPSLAPLTDVQTSSTESALNVTLQIIAGGLLYLAAPIAIIMIAFYGLRLSASFGSQEDTDGAKKGIQWAIGGLVIIMLSVVIVRFVIKTVVSTDQPNAVEGNVEDLGTQGSSDIQTTPDGSASNYAVS